MFIAITLWQYSQYSLGGTEFIFLIKHTKTNEDNHAKEDLKYSQYYRVYLYILSNNGIKNKCSSYLDDKIDKNITWQLATFHMSPIAPITTQTSYYGMQLTGCIISASETRNVRPVHLHTGNTGQKLNNVFYLFNKTKTGMINVGL